MKRIRIRGSNGDQLNYRRSNSPANAKARVSKSGPVKTIGPRPRGSSRQRILSRVSKAALREGQRIRLRWNQDWTGKIVRLGPEVSEVRFDNGGFRFIPNGHLEVI